MTLIPVPHPSDRVPGPPWDPSRVIPGMALTQYRPDGLNLRDEGGVPVDEAGFRLLEDGSYRLLEDGSRRLLEG